MLSTTQKINQLTAISFKSEEREIFQKENAEESKDIFDESSHEDAQSNRVREPKNCEEFSLENSSAGKKFIHYVMHRLSFKPETDMIYLFVIMPRGMMLMSAHEKRTPFHPSASACCVFFSGLIEYRYCFLKFILSKEGKFMFSTTQQINQLIASPVKKKKRTLLEEKHPEENRKNSGGLPNESFQSKMFRKDDVPIAYKENFIDGNPRETDVTYKIIKKREQALYQEDTKSRMIRRSSRVHEVKKYDGLSLEKSPEGKWFIKDNMNNQLFEPEADMSYIFVTMPNDTIRISTRGKHGHVSLSGFARYVKYAGEVTFDKYQRITSWNNASYSYIPPPFLAFQANFQEDTRRFHKVVDRNDPVLQVSPIFSRIQKK